MLLIFCIYLSIYTHTHTDIYMYLCIYTHTFICTHIQIFVSYIKLMLVNNLIWEDKIEGTVFDMQNSQLLHTFRPRPQHMWPSEGVEGFRSNGRCNAANIKWSKAKQNRKSMALRHDQGAWIVLSLRYIWKLENTRKQRNKKSVEQKTLRRQSKAE